MGFMIAKKNHHFVGLNFLTLVMPCFMMWLLCLFEDKTRYFLKFKLSFFITIYNCLQLQYQFFLIVLFFGSFYLIIFLFRFSFLFVCVCVCVNCVCVCVCVNSYPEGKSRFSWRRNFSEFQQFSAKVNFLF